MTELQLMVRLELLLKQNAMLIAQNTQYKQTVDSMVQQFESLMDRYPSDAHVREIVRTENAEERRKWTDLVEAGQKAVTKLEEKANG